VFPLEDYPRSIERERERERDNNIVSYCIVLYCHLEKVIKLTKKMKKKRKREILQAHFQWKCAPPPSG
jgi:hypothetical protein